MSSFYSHFFSKKFQHICVSLDVNFNESLTNDVVSFEQLGPVVFAKQFSLSRAMTKSVHNVVKFDCKDRNSYFVDSPHNPGVVFFS